MELAEPFCKTLNAERIPSTRSNSQAEVACAVELITTAGVEKVPPDCCC
jgi:hypothetical protein